ncbi:uncharacterized protein LOC110230897 [Arabidopsis lyrata subsp. lyrata]|uniref:uncharacterized protein LOC110230897 n=1 Tax=Arabidopsis lyrata subsp. lyrata TaxID=81972 RepID=UPI000A29E275|nr:uncharacterized protein LOC110230897 [Arabidopsis lyrata subsp. lyrata]|eukprot:XP_020890790.1 uncharacterized protein LOC110230897 [Arabidopsis lyrata subsp. lyrata]
MQARGGWIIRDHHGTAKAWRSLDLNGAASPLMAEAKALLTAMHQAWLRGFTQVILEGDCEVLINLINGNSSHSEVENLLQDIADSLAKFVCPMSFFLPDSLIPPIWLKELLCNYLLT